MTLISSDSGKTFEVPLGESISIRLPENPTTGYRWSPDPAAQSSLPIERQHFEPSSDCGIGGGGYVEWKVKATHEGVNDVRLKLGQPFETESSDHFEVRIVVRKN